MNSRTIVDTHECGSRINQETIDLYRSVGVSRPIAVVLTCMAVSPKRTTSVQIEQMSGLRQPEVSVAMKTLIERGWVEITDEIQKNGKGRPIKYYSLITPLEEIMASIEYSAIQQSQQILHTITKLKARVLA